MTDPKNTSVEDAINEVSSRLDEVGDDGVEFSPSEGSASEYLRDRARHVETWDGDNA